MAFRRSRILPPILALSFIILFVVSSSAKMKPIDRGTLIRWTYKPPVWFTLNWMPKPIPWFDIELTPLEYADQPVAKIFRGDIFQSFIGNNKVLFSEEGLISVEKSPFLDTLDLEYSWCDEDGLVNPNSNIPWADTTDNMGCVWVVVHAETVERSGDVKVATPEAAGYYRDHRGEEFIKVYFPEVVNASLQNFDARIKLGCCKELDPDNYETLGDIYVQGMRVKVHAGSWTDIFVHKKAPFFPDM